MREMGLLIVRVFYWVEDTRTKLWYNRRQGWTHDPVGDHTNVKHCKTLRAATRHAHKINTRGGVAVITKFWGSPRRRRVMWIPGFKPEDWWLV